MNKLLLNIIKELLDMEDRYINPVWTYQQGKYIICSFCGALSHDWQFINHDSDCIITRAQAVLLIDEE